MKTEYAIYQIGYAFFGVGRTFRSALKDANKWTDRPLKAVDILDCDDIHGEFCWVLVTPRLAQAIRERGGQVRNERLGFSAVRPGVLYGLPDEMETP